MRTSTKIDGVQSQYMPQVDAIPSAEADLNLGALGGASTVQTTTTTTTTSSSNALPGSTSGFYSTTDDTGSGAVYGEYRTTTKIDGRQSIYMPQVDAISTDLPSVPAVPTRTLEQASFAQSGDGFSEATVTPLKGSFAVSRNKYVGGMSTMDQGNKYNTSTYRQAFRSNVGATGGSSSYSQHTTVTKNYNSRTYNYKTQY